MNKWSYIGLGLMGGIALFWLFRVGINQGWWSNPFSNGTAYPDPGASSANIGGGYTSKETT